MTQKPAQAPVTVEIGTLAIEGASRTYGARAAASFEQALPAALASLTSETLRPLETLGSLDVKASRSLSPEEFGRRLAEQVGRGLQR